MSATTGNYPNTGNANEFNSFAGLIPKQDTPELRRIKYGLFHLNFNGCGVIATYNAMKLLGKDVSIKQLVELFEKKHLLVLFGLFGSSARRMPRVFEALNVKFYEVTCEDTKRDGVYIVTFWNKKPPFNGMHTVMTRVLDGQPTTWNLYSNNPVVNMSPTQFAGKRFIKGYRIER